MTLQGQRILIDCGHSVYPTLRRLDLVDSLDAVLITHLHDDHSGSLSTLLFHRKILTPTRPLRLLVPSDGFRDELTSFLRPMMGADPAAHFQFQPLHQLPGISAVDTTGHHFPGMTTYGYIFHDPAYPLGDIAFSGDIADSPVFLDAVAARPHTPAAVYHDLAFYPGGPHAHYQYLRPWLDRLPIYGYHHNHHHSPPDNPVPLVALQPGLLAPAL